MRLPIAVLGLALASFVPADARQDPAPLAAALRNALAPALPFPEARRDGTAPDSSPVPVWTVRWPEGGVPRIEVVANPLNPGNSERALAAEAAIQKSALAAQERSQGDYEQALRDFARSGRVGEIREVSLNDEGLAGERYDAESQATIEVVELTTDHRLEVATSRAPTVFPGSDGATAIVRLAANEYTERRDGADPLTRFCPEQALVVFGGRTPTVDFRRDDARAVVHTGYGPSAPRLLVVHVRGNVELVDRVLQQANWLPLRAYADGREK